jgi:hypothetical protein
MSRSRFPVFLAALVIGLVATSLLAPPATAQETTRQTREVGSFTEVAFAVPGTLHLRQGEPQSVELEGPSEVLDRIETVIEGRTLKVRSEDSGSSSLFDWLMGGNDNDLDPIDVYVTIPTVEGFSVAGSGDLIAETPIEGDDLDIQIAGSGNIEAELRGTRLSLNIAGSGDMTLRGQADDATIEIAGSGDVQAADLQVATADVSTAGSGDVEIHVTDRLSASIVGSGDVSYRGQPEVEANVVGSGDVESME